VRRSDFLYRFASYEEIEMEHPLVRHFRDSDGEAKISEIIDISEHYDAYLQRIPLERMAYTRNRTDSPFVSTGGQFGDADPGADDWSND
jgi:hypothetical protein